MSSESIFTNMFSLLKAAQPHLQWPVSLTLPHLKFDDLALSPTLSTDGACPTQIASSEPSAFSIQESRRVDKQESLSSLFSEATTDDGTTKLRKTPKPRKRRKAWLCKHVGSAHYAKGICQFCYLKTYHSKRKERLREEHEEES
mmetsp:Transcript_15663/g.28522  ORF Transcript_15663/g.28522 Transcript_15663/m.28522 type:complete len:144 (+) Transcript_15663:2399-2830(+)